MLSIDLFNSRYEKRLHEGAVDDAEYARLKKLGQTIDYLKQARAQTKDAEMQRAIDGRIKEYDDERKEILSVRGMKESEQPARPQTQQTKGIGDIQDPRSKMIKLDQQAKKGPLANVAAGIKAFVKGEPEPMGEQQELGRRGIGMANMKALQATVEKGFARTVFQFPTGKYVVGEDDTDKMADYYNALDSAGRTNFVYNVLGDGAKFIQMSRELGIQATPVEPQQPELPGMPQASPQRELPLSEKKKSNSDDLEAGDIKVARGLQKLRAEYPAARSDVEAVARAEIDSTERSQRQLAAIRGANEKQDALLKQLVALDQEQGREISGLDKENDSLEKQLDQVQRTNAALAQTVSQMTGTKKSARPAPQTTAAQSTDNVINLIPGAPADQQKVEPQPKTLAQPVTQTATAKQDTKPAPELTPNLGPISQVAKFTPPEQLIKPQKAAESKIKEHGGGIGPKQHWQDLMQEGQPQELINRYLAINAETDVDAVRKAIQAISRDSTLSATSKSRLLGQIGMIIRRHRLPIGRSYYTFMQQYMEEQTVSETVENVRAGMAKIYHRLAPKIERHRDSFLAGQLYDELENYAELHGAEGEFKRMMATARNSAHMEYDTNPGGFQNWFWFLPFEDKDVAEGWSDQGNPTAFSVYIDGREWRAYKSDEQARRVAEKVQANLKLQGRDQTVTIAPSRTKRVQEDFGMPGTTIPRKSVIQGYTVYFNPNTQMVSVTRGGDSEEAAIEQVRVGTPSMKNFRQAADRLIDKIESDLNEAKEILTKNDFLDARDYLLRKIDADSNPANKQIIRAEIRKLESQAEAEGWITMQQRMVREDSDNGEAVEMAIMRRMLVAHTDLIVEFGLDKVVDAIEEVAYNVGDVDEIGTSDVSGWVNQVKQILGADA